MSQRKFRSGKYEILTGWDRPLQYKFLVIQEIAKPNDEPCYSNLNRTNPAMMLHEIMSVFQTRQINCPPSLWHDLSEDELFNVGNVVQDYGRVK